MFFVALFVSDCVGLFRYFGCFGYVGYVGCFDY